LCKTHKLIVEVDGSQHGEDRGLAHDTKRDAHFRSKGYRIARLWNADINRDPDAAADAIWAFLHGENPFVERAAPPHPALRATLPALRAAEGE
jgi:very-short-patch-repair endonuclease